MRDVEQILNGKGAIMAKFSFYLDTRKAVDGGVYPLVLNLAHQSVTHSSWYAIHKGRMGGIAFIDVP